MRWKRRSFVGCDVLMVERKVKTRVSQDSPFGSYSFVLLFSSVGLFVSRCSNLGCFVFVDGREKSENFFCFYSTKSRECSYSTIDLHMWISG